MFPFFRSSKQGHQEHNGQAPSSSAEDERKCEEQLAMLHNEYQAAKASLATYKSSLQKSIEELGSNRPAVLEMIQSAELTLRGLQNEDSGMRYCALAVLGGGYHDQEGMRPLLLPILERMALKDPNMDVRTGAIMSLSSLVAFDVEPERKRQIGREFAKIALDALEEIEIRKAAYRALCRLNKEDLIFFKSFEDVVSLKEVDWEYVRSWQ